MKITILGTGTSQGVPVVGCHCEVCISRDTRDKRRRPAVLVQHKNTNLIIDIGPDFRNQMLDHFPGKLNAVLLTHEHNDHTAGLDDIRPFNFKYDMNIPIYGLPRVLENLERRFSYIFSSQKYPGIPRISLKPICPWDEYEIQDVTVLALPVQHGGLPILGYCFEGFAYLTDVKKLNEKVVNQLMGIKVLVISALHHNKHHSHMNLNEALALVSKLQPEQVYFTHMSHSMGLHKKIESRLPLNVKLAYDGLIIDV